MLAGLQRGDSVRAVGTIGQYRGAELLGLDSIERLGSGVVPAARAVTAKDLSGERYAGQLVWLAGRISVGSDLEVSDDSGEVLLYLRDRFFTDSRFADELTDKRRVEVVGIAEQYDSRPPFTSGYRLLPRDRGGPRFAPKPPNPLAMALAAALLLTVLSSLLIWRASSERRAAEAEALLAQRDAALQGQRRFLADAGHEIRTPITVLHGDLQVALRRSRSPDEYSAVLRRALSDLMTISHLADDLITLARTDGGTLGIHRAEIDVDELLEGVRKRYSAAATQVGVRLELEACEGLVLSADPVLVDRTVGNLVDNAIKYAAAGRVVTLAATSTREGLVRIEVTDRGPGIPPADEKRIFERFYRGEMRHGTVTGSGLGLAIVQAVMERHGGRVEVEPRAPSGTRFVLTFFAALVHGSELRTAPSRELVPAPKDAAVEAVRQR